MKLRSKLITATIFLVAFLVLVLGLGTPSSIRSFQASLLGLMTPFLKSGSSLERKFTAFREGLKSLEELEGEARAWPTAN
jgi:hypothetical protein